MWTVLSNLKNKQNVIFASPGQEIQGSTGYRYVYTPDTVKGFPSAVINQIMIGIKKNTPACIYVGMLNNGIKSQDKESFKINAPKKPGVYYVQFTFALENGCAQGAINSWFHEAYPISDQSIIGIIIVGNGFDFSVYREIWEAYSKNVPSTAIATDEKRSRADVYVSLRNFEFEKK